MQGALRVGMVGAGYAAHLRARAIRGLQSDRITIMGVFDKNPVNAREFSKEFGVRLYQSLEEMCGDDSINTVSIAVPNRHHYEVLKYAFNRNKNGMCEYPLVPDTYVKAEELVRLAREKKLFLHVGQTMNYDADYALVESLKGELGRLYMGYRYMSFGGKLGSWFELDGFRGDYQGLARWYIEDTKKGGWIVSAHYHGIQHFRRIFGEVVSVCAFDSTSRGIAAATILLKHENGASSSIQWGMPIGGKWFNKLIVSGNRGSIETDGEEYFIHTEKVQKRGNLKPIDTFTADLKSLLDKLDGKEEFAIANKDMLMNLKIALTAEQAAAQGVTIEVK